jgi:hypothetical protein
MGAACGLAAAADVAAGRGRGSAGQDVRRPGLQIHTSPPGLVSSRAVALSCSAPPPLWGVQSLRANLRCQCKPSCCRAPVASNPTCRCMNDLHGGVAAAAPSICFTSPCGTAPASRSLSESQTDALVTTALDARTRPPPRSRTPSARPLVSRVICSTWELSSRRPPRFSRPLRVW